MTETAISQSRLPYQNTGSFLTHAAILVLMGLVFAADSITSLGIAVWVLYIAPLGLSLWTWRPIVPILVALGTTIFMGINFFTDTPGIAQSIAEINRVLGLLSIWTMAITGYFFIRNRIAVRTEEWLQTGLAQLNVLISGDQRIEEMCDKALAFLVEYMGGQGGALYVQEGGAYTRAASFGIPAEGAPLRFAEDDSLLWQAVKSDKAIVLHDIPDNYLTIGSALGKSKPRHIVITPVASEGTVNAVVEIGFFQDVPLAALSFLERVAESLAVAIRSAHYRSNLQNLLEETQRQAEELQTQGEELRVSNEELEEQSRALQESQARMEQQQAEMEQTNAQLEEQTQLLETQRDNLAQAQEALEMRTRELEQSSRYKSEFLANMSHELRTPLNSSLILAKLLADNPDGNLSEEQVRYAQTIQSSGNDLLLLINDILDLSKIEAGHMEIQPEQLRIAKVVSDVTRSFEAQAQQKGLSLSSDVGDSCPEYIETDGKRLEQVLRNLLSNAVKFTEKGEVKVAVNRTADGKIAFAVIDTGIGIPAQQHDVIFEAFRQADSTTSRKYGGTGLGLSISRELVRLLGGEITLESEAGKGSVFAVILPETYSARHVRPPAGESHQDASRPDHQPAVTRAPAADAPVRRSMMDDSENLSPDKRTILIVEDDEAFARILYDLGHELGFQCLIAATADEALYVAKEYMPQAVVLDVALPDHSGLSVLDRIKQNPRTRHIPVHIVSVHDYSQTAYSMGAVGYMLKPVKREELIEALKQLENRLIHRMQRILIVEDDPVQRESVKKLLGLHNVETVGAGTAAECLELLRDGTFDCMVLDLSLPDASGYSLLETLSREEGYSFPPVIVYTGRELSADEEQQLRRYSKSIIIKGAKSPERLLDEVTLFLHHIVSDLPPEQQKMLKKAKHRDAILEDRHILVVEDDIRNVYSLTSVLEPRGARVKIARNGREALDMLEQLQKDPETAIDMILMDVMMPEMDGITATREIRKRPEWRKLPVIMLTAKAMKDDQDRCLQAGANDYMAKPLDVEQLLSLIRVWMPR